MRKLLLVLILFATCTFPQTVVTKVIDPGGHGDYYSLQAWANSVVSRGTDLTTSTATYPGGRIEIARCICTNGAADIDVMYTGGTSLSLTTDETRYVKIYADTNYNGKNYRHKGVYPSSGDKVYRIEVSPVGYPIISFTTSKVIIDGLCIQNNLSRGTHFGNCIQLADADNIGIIENCLITDYTDIADSAGAGHGHGIRVDAWTKWSHYIIRNNFIANFYTASSFKFVNYNCGILTYPTGDSLTVYVDNNTIYNCKYGYWNRGLGDNCIYASRATVRNNVFQDPNAGTNTKDTIDTFHQFTSASGNNVFLPKSTPAGLLIDEGFESGMVTTFSNSLNGGNADFSVVTNPVFDGNYSLSAAVGYASSEMGIYSSPLTVTTNTSYSLSFWSTWSWGSAFTISVRTTSGTVISSLSSHLSEGGYTFANQVLTFASGSNTSVVIYITMAAGGGGTTYFDDFQMYQGFLFPAASAYFVNPSSCNFHLVTTASKLIGHGVNLASASVDPFNFDIDYGIRPSSWDVGADQYGIGSSDTSSQKTVDTVKATSAACTDYSPNELKTQALEKQTSKVSFKYVSGYFTAYKVFSPNFFSYFGQDYPMFTHIIESSGNVYMNGKCVLPAFDLPMEAQVNLPISDSIKVVTGIPFGTSNDTTNHSIEVRTTAGGMAGVAQKIQTIIGKGGTDVYARWKMYIPTDYVCHKNSWDLTTLTKAYQSFFYIIDEAATAIPYRLLFQQDTVNRNSIFLEVDTSVTTIAFTRGSVVNIQLHYHYGVKAEIWIGGTQIKGSPNYTSSTAPSMLLNNNFVFGFGWSESGSSPIYLDDLAIDSAFIPDSYATAADGTFLWGPYDQEATNYVNYGGNIPTRGLADSCLANGVKPILSIGGWPGQFTGLDSTVGKTTWSSNTPYNYCMKDTTSQWYDYEGVSHLTGLRGHWIYNLIKLLEKKHYYGVDWDFEYIGMDTIGCRPELQAKLFPDMMQAVRQAFDTAGHSDWYMSFCTPVWWGPRFPDTAYTEQSDGVWRYTGTTPLVQAADTILWGNPYDRWMDFDRIYSICTEIHVMSYGFSGIWDPINTWSGAIWKNPPTAVEGVNGNYFNLEKVDSIVIARGYPKSKTMIGLGFFGNVWLHNSDLYQSLTGVYTNKETWSTTITIGNSDLLYPYLNNTGSSQSYASLRDMGAEYGWCDTYAQPFWKYSISGSPIKFAQCGIDSLTGKNPAESDNFFVSYDDSVATVLKLRWAYNKGFAGVFVWEITQDFEPDSNGDLHPALEDAMAANLTPYTGPRWNKVVFKKSVITSPVLISPINITTDMEPFFSWHPVAGATGYDLQVALDTNFTSPAINILNVTDTIYYSMLNALSPNQNYYWRVRAKNSLANTNWTRDSFSVWSNETPPSVTQTGTLTSTKNGNTYELMIPWHVWYVADTTLKATSARIYLNGVYVGSGGDLTMNSSNQQHDTVYYNVNWGNYAVTIVMLSSVGETQVSGNISTGSLSAPMQLDKAGINILCDHPSIKIDNNGCEADVIVISKDSTYNFTFQSIGSYNPDYSVIVKDNSFFTVCSNSGNVLTVKANRGGLTGLKIKENSSGRERYIGLAVKENGSVPKFPPYVAIGNLTQYYTEAMPFYKDFKNGNADDNKRLDFGWFYYYTDYLNNGILDLYLRSALRFGIQPSFVWYNVNHGVDSETGFFNGLHDTTWMKTYFTGLRDLMQHCDSVMEGVPVQITIEPDMIGYFKQDFDGLFTTSSYLDTTFNCNTRLAYSTGVLGSSDPVFKNYLTGFCKSLNYIIKKYYPNASIGWAYPMWAATHNALPGIIRATDTLFYFNPTGSYTIGRELIHNDFVELGNISDSLGFGYLTDWLNLEGYGYDGAIGSGGAESTNWTNPSSSSWFWNPQHFDNMLYAANTIHAVTGLPIILNGNGGHINHSLTASPLPYHSDGIFPDVTDTTGFYEDSAPDYFFGDTMIISGTNRLPYFSTIPIDDPTSFTINGSSVIWKEHITFAKMNGVIAISFGPGMQISTHNTPDPNFTIRDKPIDQYWWMTKAQRYYQNPVMK